jgi:YggT family protein
MNNPLGSAAEFLISTLFDLYFLIMLLRFLLQIFRADFYNPLSQFIVRATNPILVPMRRVIPGFGGIDASAVIALIALKMMQFALLAAIAGIAPSPSRLAAIALADLLQTTVYVFIFAIIIQVVISWVSPGLHNPMANLLSSLTEPLLRPIRRVLPPFSGIDFSTLVVLLLLQLVLILFVRPLQGLI